MAKMMEDNLIEMLIKQEGCRLKPYKDTVGKLTIGVGRNLDDVGISEAEAYMMLNNDIKAAKIALFTALPWAFNLDDNRKLVLINMTFNMGLTRLLGFKKALEAMQSANWKEAAIQMLDSTWASQVGNRAVYLAKIIETGSL
jgi:lysozyme